MPLGELIVVDLSGPQAVRTLAPVRGLVQLVLLLAIKDRATEVRFEPEREGLRMSQRVDGTLHELVAPPAPLAKTVINVIKAMAELDFVKRAPRRLREIALDTGGGLVEAAVWIEASEHGDRAIVQILNTPPAAQAGARATLEAGVPGRR